MEVTKECGNCYTDIKDCNCEEPTVEYADNVVCPHCGEEHEADEPMFYSEDEEEFTCYNFECQKKFTFKGERTGWQWTTTVKENAND